LDVRPLISGLHPRPPNYLTPGDHNVRLEDDLLLHEDRRQITLQSGVN
jgi:hypothetical protein